MEADLSPGHGGSISASGERKPTIVSEVVGYGFTLLTFLTFLTFLTGIDFFSLKFPTRSESW